MLKKFDGQEHVGQIVVEFPGASNLFKQLRIDFCCGGDRPLLDVIKEKKLHSDVVLHTLNMSYQEAIARGESNALDWREVASPELIEHIVASHHGYLREELPILSEFVSKVHRVHGHNGDHLAKVDQLFHELKVDLEQHLIAEETELFPLLVSYAKQPSAELAQKAYAKLEALESEHDHAGHLLREIREATNDFELPPTACRTYTLMYQKLADLENDMFQHVHLENNILFPRVVQVAVS